MKVLVTGASGFVGGWLARKLLDLNRGADASKQRQVRVLLRTNNEASTKDLSGAEIFIGDVTDPNSLQKAVNGTEIVFHLAGVVGYTIKERMIMQRVNVDGTKNVVEAVRKSNCRRLVHMSSIAAIGASFDGSKVLNEDSTYNLNHLRLGYYETKRDAEEIVLSSARAKSIDAISINPSNIYGAGDAQKGSRKTQVKIAQGRFPYYTSGGVSVVHVSDVVDALIAGETRGRSGERYILSGDNIKIQELFSIIAMCAGVAPPSMRLPDLFVRGLAILGAALEKRGRKGPVDSESALASLLYHWYDSSKAQRELGFKIRPAEACIRDSVEWMKKNGVIS